jgi:hypothetical protein
MEGYFQPLTRLTEESRRPLYTQGEVELAIVDNASLYIQSAQHRYTKVEGSAPSLHSLSHPPPLLLPVRLLPSAMRVWAGRAQSSSALIA